MALTPRTAARTIDPLLPLLLRPCRELHDAQNELRWLREFAHDQTHHTGLRSKERLLRKLCFQRSQSKPLQYILGNQPFGELDILCRPGVLIPRPETESYTTFLARYVQQSPSLSNKHDLRILDLCTGSGCISLLLHSLLYKQHRHLWIEGVDVSPIALRLSKDNLEHNIREGLLDESARKQVNTCKKDILKSMPASYGKWDIVVSNPPYVSHQSFIKDTSHSTRYFEPYRAMVPVTPPDVDSTGTDLSGDIFYPRIVSIARYARAQMVIMEVADESQAQRILRSVQRTDAATHWRRAAIWHDNLYNVDARNMLVPSSWPSSFERLGMGKARAVVLSRR